MRIVALLCGVALLFVILGCATMVTNVEDDVEEAVLAPVTGVVVPVAKEVSSQTQVAADKVVGGTWRWVKREGKWLWEETVVPFHGFLLKLMTPKKVER